MSTLIVRDATLAVNGAPEARGQAAQHLNRRIVEVAGMDHATVEECLEVLQPFAGTGEECDVEVLLALTVLGLAQAELAEAKGLSAVAVGRRLASHLEQAGETSSALEVVERLREAFPTHAALERDHDAILRRLGMVQDLADRYFVRAQSLLDAGNEEEALGWLREVLLLDGSRSDAARLIRDLRLKSSGGRRRRPLVTPQVLIATLIPLALVALVFREVKLAGEFETLPSANLEDLTSSKKRLDSVESFLEQHILWHGTFSTLAERSELRVRVEQLEREEEDRLAREALRNEERAVEATLIRRRGVMHIDVADFEAALADFREALEVAPEGWSERQQVERDVAAVIEYMEEVKQ
jgi:Flp pilus assembly protein TadD